MSEMNFKVITKKGETKRIKVRKEVGFFSEKYIVYLIEEGFFFEGEKKIGEISKLEDLKDILSIIIGEVDRLEAIT